ncbi:MAG: AsmA family protein [Rhodospirillales bacterium]|nr:AsmA family protein [Rhodospirillales bacterium]
MKRGMLIGGGVIGVVIIVVIAGGIFLYSSLDSLIQQAVEKYGSEVTQAKVKLNKVELDIVSGQGALRGLTIGNPQGFKTPSAFQLDAVSISLNTATVTSDPVIIKEIVIDKPDVTYEVGPQGNNFDALKNNINAYVEKLGLQKKEKSESEEGPKLIIENLYVRGGNVNVSASILEGKTLSSPMPDLHLKDIGKDKGGASPGEVAEKVLSAITNSATKAVGSLGIGSTLDSLKNKLGGVGAITESVGGTVSKGADSVGGAVTEGAASAGEGIKKLFGK